MSYFLGVGGQVKTDEDVLNFYVLISEGGQVVYLIRQMSQNMQFIFLGLPLPFKQKVTSNFLNLLFGFKIFCYFKPLRYANKENVFKQNNLICLVLLVHLYFSYSQETISILAQNKKKTKQSYTMRKRKSSRIYYRRDGDFSTQRINHLSIYLLQRRNFFLQWVNTD